jgi:integrase
VLTLHANLASHRYAGNRMLAVLSALFNHAERLALRAPSSNPCRGVERYTEAKRKRPLAGAELARLWSHLDDAEPIEGPYVVAAIRLLLLTGLRKTEVLTLRWSYIDLNAGLIRLPDTKTGPREVLLSDAASAVLKAIPRAAENPFVICGERDGQRRVNLAKPWHRLRTRLGFPRHTTASLLARRAPLVVVRDALGHRVIGTTADYSHAAADDVRAAVNALAADIIDRVSP